MEKNYTPQKDQKIATRNSTTQSYLRTPPP
jgi:hypothetical protein